MTLQNMPPVKYNWMSSVIDLDATNPNSLVGITAAALLYSQTNNSVVGSITTNVAFGFTVEAATLSWDVVLY